MQRRLPVRGSRPAAGTHAVSPMSPDRSAERAAAVAVSPVARPAHWTGIAADGGGSWVSRVGISRELPWILGEAWRAAAERGCRIGVPRGTEVAACVRAPVRRWGHSWGPRVVRCMGGCAPMRPFAQKVRARRIGFHVERSPGRCDRLMSPNGAPALELRARPRRVELPDKTLNGLRRSVRDRGSPSTQAWWSRGRDGPDRGDRTPGAASGASPATRTASCNCPSPGSRYRGQHAALSDGEHP